MPLRSRRLTAAAALACSLLVAAAGSAAATLTPIDDSGTLRIDGADRYAVSAGVSARVATAPQEEVIVGSGEVFADALAAGPVGYRSDAPILLVGRDRIADSVAAELTRLQPLRITLVGGPATISTDVETQLQSLTGATVERVGGIDRYAVAAALAARHSPEGAGTVFVVSGLVFSDALSAGPAAARYGAPVLLTDDNTLPDATADALRTLNPSKVIVVGGTATITSDVTAAIAATVPGVDVDRIDGADRYAVSAELAQQTWPSGANSVFYASGTTFPDALSGTPAAGVSDAPILLTRNDCQPYETTLATESLSPSLRVILGGTASAYSGTTTCGPKPTYPFTSDLDCKDFSSRAAAQTWFDYWYPRVGDVYRLDADNDKRVCESWDKRA